VQKRLNLSTCRFDCGLQWAEGCTSSIVFARWRHYALMEGHVAVTCRITLNHPPTAAMRLTANYFDHLLSLDTPTFTVAQIDKRFKPSTLLWAFHTIQPSSYLYIFLLRHVLHNRRIELLRTRHRASTSMYSLTFRVRVITPPQYGRNGTAHAAGASILSPARGVSLRRHA